MPPWVMVDDTAFIMNYNALGNGWTSSNLTNNQAFNSTLTSWNSGGPLNEIPPELDLTYYGTDLNIYGTINAEEIVNYTIDESVMKPVPLPVGIANGKTGINLLSLSNLTESTNHTLQLFPISGQFTFDYMTYLPNNLTLLTGTNLLLDNGAPELQYSGQWNHTTGEFPEGRPHNWTISGTNLIGSTMQVTFEGSSILVYGLLNNVEGRLSCSFVLDGVLEPDFTPFDGEQQGTDPSSWMLSQRFFYQPDLSPGQHSLLINLTDVSSQQMLWLDYIVYKGTSSTRLTGNSTTIDPSPGDTNKSVLSKEGIAVIAIGVFILVISGLVAYARRKLTTKKMRNVAALVISPFNNNGVREPHLPTILGPQDKLGVTVDNGSYRTPYNASLPVPPRHKSSNWRRLPATQQTRQQVNVMLSPERVEEPLRERDAGRVVLPPAYDDRLYS